MACKPLLPDKEQAYKNLPGTVDYNFHIKPILADKCYNCHGPDAASRKANLRLDDEQLAFSALASGKMAFKKGSLKKSEAIHRILSDDPDYQMPPPDSKLELSNEEIALIAKWIDQGAEWKSHWAYQKIIRPEVPEVDSDLIVNEVDNFIQSSLLTKGLSASERADKERLLRRVTMDVTGLPPTLEEMEAFLSDDSESAYETVVDRLLDTEAHAERLAMDWLDIARYSDSHGVSFDGYRNMWPYRDWVIESFASNMPFDQFITKQVAGDLLPNATKDDFLATAFYRMNPMEASEGSIEEEYRVEYVAERTATTGTAFLGLTVGCARCHDHKFDAISHKEFYQLSAFFNSVDERGLGPRDLNRPPTIILLSDQEEKKLDSMNNAILAFSDELSLSKGEAEEIASFVGELKGKEETSLVGYYPFDNLEKIKRKKKLPWLVQQEIDKEKKEAKKKEEKKKKPKKIEWEEVFIVDGKKGSEGTLGVSVASDGVKGNSLSFDDDYDYVSLKSAPIFDFYDDFSVSLFIKPKDHNLSETKTLITNSDAYRGFFRGWEFSLDSSNHLSLRLIHRLPDNYLEVVSEAPVDFDEWSQVGFSYTGMGNAEDIELYINGALQEPKVLANKLSRSIKPFNFYYSKLDSIPLRVGKSYREWSGDIGIFVGNIDEVKIYDRSISQIEMRRNASREGTFIESQGQRKYAASSYDEKRNEIQALLKQRSELLENGEEVMVMGDTERKRPAYILDRGLYNKYLEPVECGTPENVLPFPEDYPKNRLGLALWLTNENNPLTSRVTINRFWQMIFGVGIVKTTEDFGIQGELPSHPDLLDWLAAEFIESNWDVKHMIKLMVMSHTYRQSSKIREYAQEIDPENKYYSRSHSYRLPAEMIRDNALAVSGLLHNEIGGKSVKPYQPEGLWKDLGDFSYKLSKYERDTAQSLYRRSVYTFSRRFSPHPFMTNFDAPNREICITRRVNTNTPLQALNLLNDPQFVEASRCLSEKAQRSYDTLEDQLSYSFRLSTGMKPSIEILATMKEQYANAFTHFEQNPNLTDSLLAIGEMPLDRQFDKNKTAALAMVANTIFNYDETYMKR